MASGGEAIREKIRVHSCLFVVHGYIYCISGFEGVVHGRNGIRLNQRTSDDFVQTVNSG